MLSNEKYKGDALLQKTYTVDFLSKKRVVNKGEVPRYYVEDSHPPIMIKKSGKRSSLKWREEEPLRRNIRTRR
jgi:hypothetical protein